MRRRHSPSSLLLLPLLPLIVVALGARPLAKRLTGVDPPPFIVTAPAAAPRPLKPRAAKPKGIDI